MLAVDADYRTPSTTEDQADFFQTFNYQGVEQERSGRCDQGLTDGSVSVRVRVTTNQ